MAHHSDSKVQREAEEIIRTQVSEKVGAELAPADLAFETGALVRVDGATADESVIVEIFARQGKLKPGQQKKVALDAFKLVTLGRNRPNSRLIVVFADDDAAAYALGKGWLAQALKTWKVEVLVVELDAVQRERILAAQIEQRDALGETAEDGTGV